VVGSDVAWQQRVDEWTPDVSARAWARTIADRADGKDAREVLLVAADDDGKLSALVSGSAADDDRSGLDRRDRCPLRRAGSSRPRFRRVAPAALSGGPNGTT